MAEGDDTRARQRWSITGVLVGAGALIPVVNNVFVQGFIGAALCLWGGGLVISAFQTLASPPTTEVVDLPSVVAEPAPTNEPSPQTIGNTGSDPKPPATVLGPEDATRLEALGFRMTKYPEFTRWERTAELAEDFEELEVFIAMDGQLVADASVIDVHNQCAWRSKEASTLVFENNAACDWSKLMQRPKYQARLAASQHLVFVGMESFLNSPTLTDCHGTISVCRYIELFEQTVPALPDNWSMRRFWGLNLGHSTDANPANEFDQRRAILIGIRERRSELAFDDIITKITTTTVIKDVNLAAYEFAAAAKPQELEKPAQR